jgi:hypothetical protein
MHYAFYYLSIYLLVIVTGLNAILWRDMARNMLPICSCYVSFSFGTLDSLSITDSNMQSENILKHHGLWDRKARPPPKATGSPEVSENSIDYALSQLHLSI